VFLALLGVAVASAHLFSENEYQFLFSKWISQHNKKYNHENFFYRYTVFKRNMDHIAQHNKNAKKNGLTFTMAMNSFGDMTPEEFKATHTGYNQVNNNYYRTKNAANAVAHNKEFDDTVDWRQNGAVTPVKNQQQCGSSRAISALGSLERAFDVNAKGPLTSFSEQQLVDCSGSYGNQGCNGGLMDNAFKYIIDNGLCTAAAYPYKAVDGTCQTTCKPVVGVSSFVDVTVSGADEKELIAAVNLQPVSIAIEADQQVFQFYSGGVLNDQSCGTQLDHGVLVVGYGTDADAGPYWTVKNSWGAQWGEQGYIRLARGVNECGLDTEPSYPIAIRKSHKH
jgi:C1A family cysteine protease